MTARCPRLRRVLLALLIGALITIITSWLAMFLPWDDRRRWHGPSTSEYIGVASRSDRTKTFQITRGSSAWHTVTQYWWMQISGFSLTMLGDDPAYREIDLNSLPSHMRPKSIDELVMLSWYHATGWPMPAMTCSAHWQTQIANANIIYEVKGGMQLPRDAQYNPRALPLTPLWPGFAVNTLLWAALWLMARWSLSAARRWRRAKRNRCVHCGYSREGLREGAACPECGKGQG